MASSQNIAFIKKIQPSVLLLFKFFLRRKQVNNNQNKEKEDNKTEKFSFYKIIITFYKIFLF